MPAAVNVNVGYLTLHLFPLPQCPQLSGLHGLPQAGDEVRVVGSAPGDDARARKLALARRMRQVRAGPAKMCILCAQCGNTYR